MKKCIIWTKVKGNHGVKLSRPLRKSQGCDEARLLDRPMTPHVRSFEPHYASYSHCEVFR